MPGARRVRPDHRDRAQGGVRPSLVLAYDGWNQAAAEETCQTLRAVASEGEANDAVVEEGVIW